MPRNFSLPGRSAVRARNGMVAASHPMATAAGLKTLVEGGSAMDAALAAVALLSVAEPHMTGIGGDCFALVSPDGSTGIEAMNGSGRAPAGAAAAALAGEGLEAIPRHSPHAVTMPGAVDGWWCLHQRHGRLDWDRVLWPAAAYAEDGIAVHGRVARDWEANAGNIADDPDASIQYLANGRPYAEGAAFRHPQLAEALKIVQKEGRDGFYKGPVMEDMLAKLQAAGGAHEEADFAGVAAEFVEPIHADYRGHTVWECPPNGQGIAALAMMKVLERFDIASLPEARRVHLLAEAAKTAYHLRDAHVGDPAFQPAPTGWMLDDGHIDGLAAMIDPGKASAFKPSDFPEHPHTVYVAAVDGNGMAVSLINSLFDSFGSGISTPRFGVLFQSRGRAFTLEEGHPNALEGGKRPLHTIIPAMLGREGRLLGPFGVMGGEYQAAGHAMLVSNLADLGLDPQEALDAPRSFAYDGVLQLEEGHGAGVAESLEAMGHVLEYPSPPIGGGQAILKDGDAGFWVAGSDPRKDGHASGY